jgi:hypothetical protein
MTDDQLRGIIREAVARHLAAAGPIGMSTGPLPAALAATQLADAAMLPALAPPRSSASLATHVASGDGAVSIASAPGGIAVAAAPGAVVHFHVSHATFTLPTALDGSADGPCITEPHAGCTSCGFCQSLGY